LLQSPTGVQTEAQLATVQYLARPLLLPGLLELSDELFAKRPNFRL
jgi:hypothetical protein